jgi:hypothetical protein
VILEYSNASTRLGVHNIPPLLQVFVFLHINKNLLNFTGRFDEFSRYFAEQIIYVYINDYNINTKH